MNAVAFAPAPESYEEYERSFRQLERLMRVLGDDVGVLWSDAMRLFLDTVMRRRILPERRRRFLRAAVLTAAAAFESVTNFLSEQLAKSGEVRGRAIDPAEVDALREMRKVLECGRIRERKQLYTSKERFLLLYRLVSGGSEYKGKLLEELDSSFGVRDRLVHPKPDPRTDPLDERALKLAFFGFLRGDMLLAAEWARESA